jgi:hypothetical protein
MIAQEAGPQIVPAQVIDHVIDIPIIDITLARASI